MNNCIIVGAGMAGLMAARALEARGVRATVLDKGRGVGGRMATRWRETESSGRALFDHGAQFFTVRDARFARWVEAWQARGLVREWARGFADASGTASPDGHPRYIGVGGMNAIARDLAEGLSVRVQAKAERIVRVGREWRVQLEGGDEVAGEALILTPPVPQSLALVGEELPAEARAALARIEYDPCFALLPELAEPSRLPAPGGLKLGPEPIAWIADNRQKGISPEITTLTVHAGPEFTRRHWDDPPDFVAGRLLEAARDWLGAPVSHWQLHRWRYSQAREQYPAPCLRVDAGAPLVFAGDAFGAPRVEGAALSGMAAAEALRG